MFVIIEYDAYGYRGFLHCRTKEKAKKVFIEHLNFWLKRYGEGQEPADFSDTATTWEELWEELWEDKIFEEVVSCEEIMWEEDKIGD